MTDDKNKDNGEEVGGVKDRLRDEFNEASGKKKGDKDNKKTEASKGGDKNPGDVKDNVKDEFDDAAGKKKGKNDQDEGGKDS